MRADVVVTGKKADDGDADDDDGDDYRINFGYRYFTAMISAIFSVLILAIGILPQLITGALD